MARLKEAVTKMKAQLKFANSASNAAKKKLNFVRKVTEERLKECLPVPSFKDDHSSVLITLMSTLMEEDCFETDPNTDVLKPREDFLKNVEESFEQSTDKEVIKDHLDFVKNKLLERVKELSSKNRERRLSVSSSVGSQDGRKRRSSAELERDTKVTVRNKSSSIPELY